MKIVDRLLNKELVDHLTKEVDHARNAAAVHEARSKSLYAQVQSLGAAHEKLGQTQLALIEAQTAHVRIKEEIQSVTSKHQEQMLFELDLLGRKHAGELGRLKAVIEGHNEIAAVRARDLEEAKSDVESADAHSAASQLALTNLQDEHVDLLDEHKELLEANEAGLRISAERLNCINEQNQRIVALQSTIASLSAGAEAGRRESEKEAGLRDALVAQLRDLTEQNEAKAVRILDWEKIQLECTEELNAAYRRIGELERGLRTPIENDLLDQLAALKAEHDCCLKYGGETIKAILKHRDKLIAETSTEDYLKYKKSHGLK